MKRFSGRSRGFALSLLALAVGAAVAVSPAMAIDPPTVTPSPSGPSNSGFSFSFAAAPDPGQTVTGYEGGLDGADPAPLTSPTPVIVPAPDGAHTFRVRALQSDGAVSDYAVVPIVVDTSKPTLSVALDQAAGPSGWITAPLLNIVRTCSPDVGSCGPIPVTTQGTVPAQPFTVTDLAGNTSDPATLPSFNYDNVPPVAGTQLTPSSLAVVPGEPTFEWSPGTDATSKVAEYQVQIRIPDVNNDTPPITTIAKVQVLDPNNVGNYSVKRQPALAPDPLPEGTKIEWRVRTIDTAGNGSNTGFWSLKIDSTIPAAPTITGGPSGPTRDTSPTFTWDGRQPTFKWDVRVAGSETPVREGAGTTGRATLSSLPDGNYIFRVTQITEAGLGSAEATRTFTVDTTPPSPPAIQTRPTFPAISAPVFTWTAEPGAYSRWVVIGPSGTPIIGPIDTPVTNAALPPLADGAYSFQVQQIDAAGNVSSATSEPFTVLAPLVPDPAARATTSSGGTITALALPKQNASRLRPKAGKVLPTLAPVLRWSRGPRGTKLYNLQIFKVTQLKKAGARAKVTKIFSAFPRSRQARAPKKRLRAHTCYVWRVWPYTGRAFTAKPVGVSNFCTARAKVIRAKARAAKIRAARARAAKIRAAKIRAAKLRSRR